MAKPNEEAQLPPSPCFALSIETPRTQSMDSSDDTSYRIPPSVFSRNKSSNPGEWSSLSNDSLFSINVDTMSFTRDHVLWKSGELGIAGEPFASDTASNGGGLTKEKLMAIDEEHKTRHSRESGTSTTSFAFPLLGEHASTKINSPVIAEQEKTPAEDPPNTDSKTLSNAPADTDSKALSNAPPDTDTKTLSDAPPDTDSKTLSNAPSKTEASTNAAANTAATNPNQSSWFSCFPCFPCCRSAS